MAGYTLEERRATFKRFKYVRLTAQEGWSSCLLCPALSVLAGPSAMQRLLHLILPFSTVKYLRAGPTEMPFQNWYTANTNHFQLTDSVSWKSKIQLG